MGLLVPSSRLKGPAVYVVDQALTSDAEHYLRRVHRLRDGDCFVALNGRGAAHVAQLTATGFCLGEPTECVPEPTLKLDVYLALAKGERFDRALEKLAELGVHRLLPLTTNRTQVSRVGDNKRARWSRIARSGSALACRGVAMEVTEPTSFSQAVTRCGAGVLLTQGVPTLNQVPTSGCWSLFVGPEGGFSGDEIALAQANGLALAGLGPRNLRVETAAVAGATLALFLSGAWT